MAFLKNPITLLALAVILIAFQALFCGKTITPIYTQGFIPEGSVENLDPPLNKIDSYVAADTTGAFAGDFAYATYVKKSLLKGDYPFWNPYQMLGDPFADAGTGVLYPPNWLRLIIPDDWFDVVNLVNWFLLALFVFLFVRELGLEKKYSLLSALTVLACSFTQIYMATNSISATLAWFPLFLLGLEQARKSHHRWAVLTLSIATYGLLNGFHPGPALSAFITGFLFFIFKIFSESKGKFVYIFRVGLGFMAGLLLSSFQILPFLHHILFSGGSALGTYLHNYFNFNALSGIVFPNFFGTLNVVLTSLKVDSRFQYLFLPTLPLFFCVVTFLTKGMHFKDIRWNSSLTALVVLFILTAAWVFGLPPLTYLHQFPGLRRMNMNYLLGISVTLFSIISGFAFRFVVEEKKKMPTWVNLIGAVLLLGLPLAYAVNHKFFQHKWWVGIGQFGVIFVVLSLIGWIIISRLKNKTIQIHYLIFNVLLSAAVFFISTNSNALLLQIKLGLWSMGFGILFFVVLNFVPFLKRRTSLISVFFTGLVIFIFHLILYPHNPLPYRKEPFKQTAFVKRLIEINPDNLFRSYGLDGYLFPNSSMTSFISSMNVLNTIANYRDVDFFRLLNDRITTAGFFYGTSLDSTLRPVLINKFFENKKFWDYAGTRYIVTNDKYINLDWTNPFFIHRLSKQFTPTTNNSSITFDCKNSENPKGFAIQFSGQVPPSPAVMGIKVINRKNNRRWNFEISSQNLSHFKPIYLFSKEGFCSANKDEISVQFKSLDPSIHFPNKQLILTPYELSSAENLEIAQQEKERNTFQQVLPFKKQFSFPIYCPSENITGVDVYLSTYGHAYKGDFSLELENLNTGRRILINDNADVVTDNTYVPFLIPSDICAKNGDPLMATLRADFKLKNLLALWSDRNMNIRFLLHTPREKQLENIYHDKRTNAFIWENKEAKPRVYFSTRFEYVPTYERGLEKFAQLKNLREKVFVTKTDPNDSCLNGLVPTDEPADFSVHDFKLSNNTVALDIDTKRPGIVTLVDSYRKGWSAFVDGIARPIHLINGVFRGVCLEKAGKHKVVMRYRPPTLFLSIIGFSGGLILLFFGLAFQKPKSTE